MSYSPDPWNQQGYQQNAPQPGYQQPYGAQPYGVAGYGYGVPVHEPPSSGPGWTAFIMALVAFLISAVLSWWGGDAYADILRETGTTEIEADQLPEHLQGKLQTVGMSVLAQLIPTIIGVIALVLSGRAIGKRGSKGLGILGLVTALVAPVLSFVIFVAVIAPAVN